MLLQSSQLCAIVDTAYSSWMDLFAVELEQCFVCSLIRVANFETHATRRGDQHWEQISAPDLCIIKLLIDTPLCCYQSPVQTASACVTASAPDLSHLRHLATLLLRSSASNAGLSTPDSKEAAAGYSDQLHTLVRPQLNTILCFQEYWHVLAGFSGPVSVNLKQSSLGSVELILHCHFVSSLPYSNMGLRSMAHISFCSFNAATCMCRLLDSVVGVLIVLRWPCKCLMLPNSYRQNYVYALQCTKYCDSLLSDFNRSIHPSPCSDSRVSCSVPERAQHAISRSTLHWHRDLPVPQYHVSCNRIVVLSTTTFPSSP